MKTAATKSAMSKAPKAPNVGPKTDYDDDRKWKAEDALRTLSRAEEIRRDSGLMRDVEQCRKDKMRDLASIKVEIAPKTMKAGK